MTTTPLSGDVFEAVRRDLNVREAAGFREHGKPMRFDDPGRDWLQEAYEELLDGAMYLKAQLMLRAATVASEGEKP